MHYYTRAGESMHEVTGANGKIRPTTISDARKLSLVPSVTTVMDVQSKPGLINWMQGQILDAVLANPYNGFTPVEQYRAAILNEARRIGREAADKGTAVHNMLDDYFISGKVTPESEVYVTNVIEILNKEFGSDVEWVSEEGFAHCLGFGGRVDLHSKSHNIIVDFKTKDKEDIKSIKPYDDHHLQLAAYQIGLALPETTRRYNLFISTHKATTGECSLVQAKDFDRPWNMFLSLLEFWQHKNKYNSAEAS